jgi:hypothetical protein
MKTISKFISGISLSVFATSIFVAVPVYARQGADNVTPEPPKTETSSTSGGGSNQPSVFCKNIDTVVSKTTGEVAKRGGSASSEWQKRANNIQTKRAEWLAKVTAARAEAAKKRDENFAKLDAAATTDTQKAAVTKYKQAVLDAVAARQTAHDANFEAYFKAVDALLASQKNNSGGDVVGFQASVAAAISTAKASCASGASADSIKTALNEALKAARENFKGQRTQDKSAIKSQLDAIKKTRNDANKKANDTFKATVEAARTELKAAFPSTSTEKI